MNPGGTETYVQLQDGKLITLQLEFVATVEDAKAAIAAREGLPPER